MSRYCASCGTEVDDTAIFCPTCGQPIDQEVEAAIPPAPAWPDPSEAAPAADAAPAEATRPMDPPSAPEPEPPAPAGPVREEPSFPEAPAERREPEPIRPVSERRYEPPPEPEPVRAQETAPRPTDAPAPGAGERREGPPRADAHVRGTPPAPAADPTRQPSGPGTPASAPSSPLSSLPVSAPVTLSGWLIGVGAAIAAVGALISLFDGFGAAVDLLLLVALAGVALSVFFSAALPAFSQLRLIVLAIVLVAFGAAMDRLLTGVAGAGELLLFLGTAAAVIGALLVELGRDQPLGGPQS